VVLSEAARQYKQIAATLLGRIQPQNRKGDKRVIIMAFPPDKRRRDIDNIEKALLDTLKGVAYDDDFQIADKRITRGPVVAGGKVEVLVQAI
jgi:crossover junction endodeoxyribonuclease RusA